MKASMIIFETRVRACVGLLHCRRLQETTTIVGFERHTCPIVLPNLREAYGLGAVNRSISFQSRTM